MMRYLMIVAGVLCLAVGIIGRGEVPGFFYIGAGFLAAGFATIDIVSELRSIRSNPSAQ